MQPSFSDLVLMDEMKDLISKKNKNDETNAYLGIPAAYDFYTRGSG
jgi:hypothetical protein